jgi:prepilin signal peptidase PulO-like enzyme (type II secretory pathway)
MGIWGALLFFLAGIPAALLVHALIQRFVAAQADGEQEAYARGSLPWQQGDRAERLRLGFAAATPLLMAAAGLRFEPAQAAAVSALLAGLLVCAATDLLRYRVPNAITYPGVGLAFVAVLALPGGDLLNAALGALLGGGSFLVISVATRGGLGLGDVKLALLIGAALGLPAAYQALVLGIVAGGVVILLAFLAGKVGRKQALPYAPFLAAAAIVVVLVQGAAFAPL